MEKLKCITHGCKSTKFFLISEEKFPTVVNENGEVISQRTYTYKCIDCSQVFTSNIGPNSPNKRLLHE